ncbi:hypothetical protein E2562_007680 [Oryza meyeriana var. granulata]|uniref:Uncharacterized protein n=1 Tax=Oryza meyeriana var. granulata TaxID=110450 RepID=A0A6G1EGF8_9ORYZ|nr:hypothetical protein E2562_007680 [Oryza meyeriana var. granulata]
MEIVTARRSGYEEDSKRRRQRKVSDGHVVAQLLDSPLPTPRRSCCGSSSAAGTPRSVVRCGSPGGDAPSSPQRTHVPFSWESSPGVPKDACGGKVREVLPPRPPPGRGGGGTPAHAHARAYFGNTTETTSSDDDDADDTFSDALDRISASDRFAAFSARLSSIDGAGSLRLPSFIMDRFLPAANAIATTSADKHPKKTPCRTARCSKHDDEATAAARRRAQSLRRASAREQPKAQPPRHVLQREESEPTLPPPPRQNKDIDEEAQSDEMSPRACGFMLFLPWSVKPVLCGFARSPARSRTPRADVSTAASSPPRPSVTLGNVLEKEKEKESKLRSSDPSRWSDEKSGSGREWSSPGWGTAILGTSKRYCADARKALSRLARSATDGRGSPAVSRARRSGKPAAAASPLRSTSGEMPPLKPPSESWLCHARGNSNVRNRR